jgi:hypothetical protein
MSQQQNLHKAAQIMGHAGGSAPHPEGRGLQNADQATREKVASAGGSTYHEKRGATGTDDPKHQATRHHKGGK